MKGGEDVRRVHVGKAVVEEDAVGRYTTERGLHAGGAGRRLFEDVALIRPLEEQPSRLGAVLGIVIHHQHATRLLTHHGATIVAIDGTRTWRSQ